MKEVKYTNRLLKINTEDSVVQDKKYKVVKANETNVEIQLNKLADEGFNCEVIEATEIGNYLVIGRKQ